MQKINKHITIKHCVVRLVMAWCFVCLLETIQIFFSTGMDTGSLEYVGYVSLIPHIFLIFVLFAAEYVIFELIEKEWIEKLCLFCTTFFYALITVIQNQDTYFCLGIMALMLFTIVYACDSYSITLNKGTVNILLLFSGIIFVAFTGGCTALRVLTFSSPNFDLGLFSQMFHYMKTKFTMNTTSERDMLLSHMHIHVSYDYYLLLPFYAVFSSPVTLQVMQAVVIALGIIPLVGICKNHGLSSFETLLAGVAYFAYPVMSGGCFYDIHENLFLPLVIFCLLYFFEKEKFAGVLISLVFLFGVKEDAAIYGACIALYMLLCKRKAYWKQSVSVLVLCIFYFMFTSWYLSATGEGVMSYRFSNMMYGGDSMLAIIQTVLADPVYILTQIFVPEKVEFLIQTVAALAFLPLLTKKWERLILFVPFVLFNLMSDYTYFHSIYFQYVFGSGTLLVYLAVVNGAELSDSLKKRAFPMLAVSCLLMFNATVFQRGSIVKEYFNEENQKTYAVINEALSLIPDDAEVTATTFLCPALSDRDILYELRYTDKETEYVAIDLRSDDSDLEKFIKDKKYEMIYYSEGKIAVLRNKDMS
jgi:uncharacterized membrane protein